ncbi:MAG: multidrug MFS transporter [Rhodobacterales bacterium]|nr:MAG: multidrug MFS transporter [Rhodobacterales bacterium]
MNRTPLSRVEFIAMIALIMATTAFSIDAMLPALPEIAGALSPTDPNRAQLVITSFVLGLGAGTLFTGPLSDAFGRKPVVVWGALLYTAGALLAWHAPTLELLLAARVTQGLGAAGARVVAIALIRDLYAGRGMARIMSFIMMVFTLVPAIAPTLGAVIMGAFGWRQIFPAFVGFAIVSTGWLMLRQPETLAPEARRPFRPATLRTAAKEVLSHPTVLRSMIAQTLCFGMLFGMLSSTQPLFDDTYGRGDQFPMWFGGIALVAATGSMLNARLVMRMGMRALVRAMLSVQIALSSIMALAVLLGLPASVEFPIFVVWTTSVFFQMSLTVGNLNALAMEPMGHIAGLAASVISAVSTVGAVMIAAPLGLAFNGTPLPLALGIASLAAGALWVTHGITRDNGA